MAAFETIDATANTASAIVRATNAKLKQQLYKPI
jgi:hypothetical protein